MKAVMNRKRWLALGATVAAVGALASVHVASAHGGIGRGGADRNALLAESLGISVDKLQAAQEQAFEKGVAQAVEAGDIAQADADLMLARNKLGRAIDHEAIMAEALGVTVDELAAADKDGKSMRDLITEKGFDTATLRQKLEAARTAAVAKAVADGVITREQADQLGDMCGGMRGGMRGEMRGGMRGEMRGGMRGFGHGMHGGHRGVEGFRGPLTPERGGAEIGEPDPAGLGGRIAPLGGQDL